MSNKAFYAWVVVWILSLLGLGQTLGIIAVVIAIICTLATVMVTGIMSTNAGRSSFAVVAGTLAVLAAVLLILK